MSWRVVPTGNRRFGDDDLVAVERGGDLVGGLVNEGEIGGIFAAPGGRADGDHHHIGGGDRRGKLDSEAQPAGAAAGAHQVLEPRLMDRHSALLKRADPFGVMVDQRHVIAELGETGPRHQAHVARTDDGNLHDAISLDGAGPCGLAGDIAGDG